MSNISTKLNNNKITTRIFLLLYSSFFLASASVYAEEALQKQTANKVTFELMECKLSGKMVHCVAYATSPDRDRTLGLAGFGNTKMYDDSGNVYQPKTLHIANLEGPNSHVLRGMLISGIRTKLQLDFENVSTNARTVAKLDFKGKVDNQPLSVSFRNVPITK